MTTKRPGLPYRQTQSLVRKWTPLPPEFPAPCQSLGRRPWWIVTLPIRGIRRVLTRNNADKGSEFRQSHYIYSNPVKFTEVYSSIKWFVWLNMIYSIHLSVCLSVLRCVVKKMQQCTKFLNIFKVTAYETHCYQIITFSLSTMWRCKWIQHSHERAPRCVLTKSVGYSLPGNVQAGPGSLSEARIVRKGPTKIYDRPVYKEVDVSVDEYGDNALRIFVRINGSLSFDK